MTQDLEAHLQAVRQDDAVDSDLEDAPWRMDRRSIRRTVGIRGTIRGRSATGPRCARRAGGYLRSMPSRRDAIRLTPGEQREFLESGKTLYLASNGKDGFPHIVAMWYGLDGADVVMTTYRRARRS